MAQGADTKISQVNAEEYEAYFEGFLAKGYDILHVCLSSGLSGAINSANIAKETLLEKYRDRTIYIVDSLGASSGYGLIMDKFVLLHYRWKNFQNLRHHWKYFEYMPSFKHGQSGTFDSPHQIPWQEKSHPVNRRTNESQRRRWHCFSGETNG